MEDQNVVILLDKFAKLLEQGNVPKVIAEIYATITTLERNLTKAKGIRVPLINMNELHAHLVSSDVPLANDIKNIANHQNMLAKFINERFPVN